MPTGARLRISDVLQLRVYGESPRLAAVAERLGALPGTRHVGVVETRAEGESLLSADLRPDAADAALAALDAVGIPAQDIALIRLDTIAPDGGRAEVAAVIWTDILNQARTQARAPARYLVLMAAAGVIAALAVVNDSATLIVGAMAISPDLLPVTATCTGLVFRRGPLVQRGLTALAVGLATAGLFAAIVSVFLDSFDLFPKGFSLDEFSAVQTHVNTTTILVAFAAGVAGMLAVETRAGATIGVAISVTTIPAVAYLGVAAGIGELRTSLSALGVLAANVTMMVAGGSIALAVQRARARTDAPAQ
jgi:uncharacterized hydrophobic protein (TIGR00271 family)